MTAPLPAIRVDGPALISRMPDEGVIVVEPLRVVRAGDQIANRRHVWLSRNRGAA